MKDTVNTRNISMNDEGMGPGLLFLHAGIADRRMWSAQIARYRGAFRCVAPDLRGFGAAPAATVPFSHHRDALAILDDLGVDRVVAIGNSYGGNVALDLAIASPNRVAGVVLVSTLAGMEEPSVELRDIWVRSDSAFEEGDIDLATDIELDAWVAGGRPLESLDPAFRDAARAMIRRVWERAAADPEPPEEIELEPPALGRLGELRMPVLLIQGDHDLPDVPISMARLHAGIVGSRSETIQNAGHLPPMERPAEFNEVLSGFLASIGGW